MTKGDFKKVGKSSKILFGPRAMLVCGFAPKERTILMDFIRFLTLEDLPVIFTTATDGETPLKDLVARPDQTVRDADSGPVHAIILSGITENELHQILSSYNGSGLPRPLWATLTPISQNWPLSALVAELQKERTAMKKRNRSAS